MRPFRFGIQSSHATSPAAWRSHARKLEDLGYSTLFLPDHLDEQWAPLTALAVAAEATTTLKVGSLVFGNDYRHPVVLAKECATLDLLSEGRLEVGLGAGWLRADYEQAGVAYDGASRRVERLEEAVRVLRALFRQEKVDFAGKHYKLEGAVGYPRPYREGGPPVIIGGGGRRVLRIAVEHADIVGVNASLESGEIDERTIVSVTAARFAERIEWVREAAGERFGDLELQSLTFVTEVGRPAAAIADDYSRLFGFPPEEVAGSPTVLVGTESEIVDTLVSRREEMGFSYWVLHDKDVDAFAPIVARLAGT